MLSDIAAEFKMTVSDLKIFLSDAINWREESKYIFTKGLSFILDLIKKSNPHELFDDQLIHFLKIEEILSLLEGETSFDVLTEIIKRRKRLYDVNRRIELPEIIKNPSDFDYFDMQQHEINFIGDSSVTGELIELNVGSNGVGIEGKIVLIESADPGYDWIFGHTISGLITEYGGSNSHMAIRAAEYRIPAAIGIGRKAKEEIRMHSKVTIDCENKILIGS